MRVRRFFGDERGNIVLLGGFLLPVAAIAVGLVVDYAGVLHDKTQFQVTADAAVAAAARTLVVNSGEAAASRDAAAQAVAAAIIKAKFPDAQSSVSASSSTNTIQVQIWKDRELAFGSLLGVNTMTVAAKSAATYKDAVSPCIVALGADETAGVDVQDKSVLFAPNCSVWSNSASAGSLSFAGQSNTQAKKLCAVGAVSTGGQPSVTPPPQSQCTTMSDPFAGRIVLDAQPCKFTGLTVPSSTATVYLDPGVYCDGLTINDAPVVMRPGLYEFRNGPLSVPWSQKPIQADGVSWVFTGSNAFLNVGWTSGDINLSAMTTGALAGIAVAATTPAAPPLTSTLNSQGRTTISGSIYLPTQRFVVSEGGTLSLNGAQDKLVALSLSLRQSTASPAVAVYGIESGQSTAGGIQVTQ